MTSSQLNTPSVSGSATGSQLSSRSQTASQAASPNATGVASLGAQLPLNSSEWAGVGIVGALFLLAACCLLVVLLQRNRRPSPKKEVAPPLPDVVVVNDMLLQSPPKGSPPALCTELAHDDLSQVHTLPPPLSAAGSPKGRPASVPRLDLSSRSGSAETDANAESSVLPALVTTHASSASSSDTASTTNKENSACEQTDGPKDLAAEGDAVLATSKTLPGSPSEKTVATVSRQRLPPLSRVRGRINWLRVALRATIAHDAAAADVDALDTPSPDRMLDETSPQRGVSSVSFDSLGGSIAPARSLLSPPSAAFSAAFARAFAFATARRPSDATPGLLGDISSPSSVRPLTRSKTMAASTLSRSCRGPGAPPLGGVVDVTHEPSSRPHPAAHQSTGPPRTGRRQLGELRSALDDAMRQGSAAGRRRRRMPLASPTRDERPALAANPRPLNQKTPTLRRAATTLASPSTHQVVHVAPAPPAHAAPRLPAAAMTSISLAASRSVVRPVGAGRVASQTSRTGRRAEAPLAEPSPFELQHPWETRGVGMAASAPPFMAGAGSHAAVAGGQDWAEWEPRHHATPEGPPLHLAEPSRVFLTERAPAAIEAWGPPAYAQGVGWHNRGVAGSVRLTTRGTQPLVPPSLHLLARAAGSDGGWGAPDNAGLQRVRAAGVQRGAASGRPEDVLVDDEVLPAEEISEPATTSASSPPLRADQALSGLTARGLREPTRAASVRTFQPVVVPPEGLQPLSQARGTVMKGLPLSAAVSRRVMTVASATSRS